MGRPLNKRNFTTAADGATAGKNESESCLPTVH